ncbi:mitochondrial ribosome-associated GTPase 2 [Trichonephila inaurata madagascariensis]|uniref:Mitochondrial ribosome-associated GTPase 2 n=1 Tax=Trichonephila inaurata madagascariensis TaxID=2747483 RepID=A0A8X7BXW6_9ARAC|nr:mitochondrial ribosome-associated GTPase 2 [Trichonephila inaurata madagascariensis]
MLPKSFNILCFEIHKYVFNRNCIRFCSKISAKPLRKVKSLATEHRTQRFIDFKSVTAIGGKGGDGLISFLRLYKNPFGGPSGGDGGNGGHVIFQACGTVKSLEDVPVVLRGNKGYDGRSKHMHGASGEHFIVRVPVGTLVKENDIVLCDLNEQDAKFIAARGGAGGHGNHFFLSNENRHPDIAEKGASGEQRQYDLELKIMAHIGLVGFPNAGKSTLLRAISRARPKIAAYPFTTLNPHIGIVHYDDYVQLAVADLPGLIPGAHENRGLGISFLRHIERCSGILYVIDVSIDSPVEQLNCLKYELEQYQKGLSSRPHAIVANKCDLEGCNEKVEELKQNVSMPIFPVSAKFGNNVLTLLKYIRKLYDEGDKPMIW